MDDVTWGALAAALTLVGVAYTYWAFVKRGSAAGTRGLALTLLPVAAWLTGTLRMFTRIGDAVGDWATGLVFDPRIWVGTGLAGLAVVLWVVGGFMHGRNAVRAQRAGGAASAEPGTLSPAASLRRGAVVEGRSGTGSDDTEGLDDIEAILKRRGIS